MDESPRASKRRKLEAPSSVRKSTRTTRTTYKADGSPKDIVKEDADVWDDIEGALGDSPTKHLPSAKKRSTRKTLPNGSASTDGTPKAPSGRTSASLSALKPPTTAPLKAAEEDTEGQDDGEVATPSRRASKRTPLASTRKPRINKVTNHVGSPIKPSSLRKPRSRAQAEVVLDAEETLVLATPSSRRKRQPRFRDDETIPETDEEPAARQSSASKQSSARRQANRADNTKPQSETWANAGEKYGSPIPEESDDDAMSVDGNSIMGSVLDPTEPSPFNKPSSAQKEKPDIPPLLTFIEPGHELDLLKTIVLDRISGKRPVPVVGLDDAYKSVHQLVEHTVTAGEGNSMLLIGARGSGKTALVNKVLAEVSKDNGHEYHVVRLNGFVHTDDKIALREIWRQLGKEMELEEEGGGVGKNYADTLTTLLALLSHPSEHTGEYTDQVAKAVIFIMDEFDLFAQHPRQTLLYNLFDIAQSRKAPIAVLGLTTRIDVANSLEKRVKSRFSHRYAHLSLAKTFTAFQEICKANLLVQPDSLTIEERGILESATKKSRKTTTSASTVLSQWNSSIDVSALFVLQILLLLTPLDPLPLQILPYHAFGPSLLPL